MVFLLKSIDPSLNLLSSPEENSDPSYDSMSYIIYGDMNHSLQIRQILFYCLHCVTLLREDTLDHFNIQQNPKVELYPLIEECYQAMFRMGRIKSQKDSFESLKLAYEEDGTMSTDTPSLTNFVVSNIADTQFRKWYSSGSLELRLFALIFNIKFLHLKPLREKTKQP